VELPPLRVHPLRLAAGLLRTVKADRARDLGVEARHRVADHLRHAGDVRIFRLGIGAAEADKTVALFPLLGHLERLVEILGDGLRDRAAAIRDAAAEDLVRLDEDEVRGPRTDVDDQRAAVDVAVVVAEGVIDGHRRDIDEHGFQLGLLDGVVDVVEQIGFDGDDDDFDLIGVAAIDELIVPDDLVNRVGDVLLGLEGDDLIDLLFADRRQLDEAGENGLRRDRVIDLRALQLAGLHHLVEDELGLPETHRIHRGIGEQFPGLVRREDEPAVLPGLELGEPNGLGAETQTQDARGCCHELVRREAT
jgi:hypothetical protein